jgi:hypothetical protein
MELWMKAILSVSILSTSVFIILRRPKDREAREYAVWLTGMILGYWLR